MKKLSASARDFWRYRYLLQNLIGRDFKLKYRRSVLGVLWSVLNPLLMCFVMWVVFSSIFDMRGAGIENFPVYLMIGQLLFSFFGEATSVAMSSMLGAAPLIKKVYIPKYIFPLEKVCFAFINCIFSFIALGIVMLITGTGMNFNAILCIYPLVTLFFFCLGIGLALSAMAVFFRDIMHLWGVFTTALMYFSAIFYDLGSLSHVPLARFIQFNPLYWYITTFRTAVLYGEPLTLDMVLVCAGCAVVALGVGLFTFHREQDKFVLYI